MKKLLIISALVAAMAGTSVVQADDNHDNRGGGDRHGQDNRGGDNGNRGGDHGNWQGNRGGDNGNRGNWQGNNNGRSEWRGDRPNPGWQGQRFQAPRPYYRPNGYQVRRWNNGDRLPYAYRGRQYYVTDYRTYNLSPPPYGYRYVRVDNDVVLAAVATGVIATVISGLYY